MKNIFYKAGLFLIILSLLPQAAEGQKRNKTKNTNSFSEALYSSMEYRLVGPFRGGRSAAVTGVPGKPNLFYFGAAGGGVWRTMDGGRAWENISDGFFGGSTCCWKW